MSEKLKWLNEFGSIYFLDSSNLNKPFELK